MLEHQGASLLEWWWGDDWRDANSPRALFLVRIALPPFISAVNSLSSYCLSVCRALGPCCAAQIAGFLCTAMDLRVRRADGLLDVVRLCCACPNTGDHGALRQRQCLPIDSAFIRLYSLLCRSTGGQQGLQEMVPPTATGGGPASRNVAADEQTPIDREDFRMKCTSYLRRATVLGATVAAALALNVSAWADGPEVVAGPSADPKCYVPWSEQTKFFKFPAEDRPVSHRARQRLHRQHLAHPDDQDRQGLCRPARSRGQAEGVQGGVDRRGRRRADRRDQQLHRFRL